MPKPNDDRLRACSTPENSWFRTNEFNLVEHAVLHDAVTLPTRHEQTRLGVDHRARRDQCNWSNVDFPSQHCRKNYRWEGLHRCLRERALA
jgi:hypothetical protein